MKLQAIGSPASVEYVIVREDGKMLRHFRWIQSEQRWKTLWTQYEVNACRGNRETVSNLLRTLQS